MSPWFMQPPDETVGRNATVQVWRCVTPVGGNSLDLDRKRAAADSERGSKAAQFWHDVEHWELELARRAAAK